MSTRLKSGVTFFGYRLQANVKTAEGAQHADRDAQFAYLNDQATAHLACGDPVISVDTKKKELVGAYENGGRQWQPTGEPEPVKVHDFLDPTLGKANPYGVYDVGANIGWVSVGTDHDTAAFAVNTIRTWWHQAGNTRYPHASRLLICADGGGSNGYRTRQWKTELAKLAAATGLTITVCHLPVTLHIRFRRIRLTATAGRGEYGSCLTFCSTLALWRTRSLFDLMRTHRGRWGF